MQLQRWVFAGPIFLLASLFLCGCMPRASAPSGDRPPSTATSAQLRFRPPRNAPQAPGALRTHFGFPVGGWVAQGQVITAHGYLHRRAGEVLTRPWLFTTTCHKGAGCRTRFLRMTDVGPSATFLVSHHGYFTADFPPVSVPCLGSGDRGMAPGMPGHMYSFYKLRWSADRKRLIAVERSVSHDRCVPASSRTRWTAVSSTRGDAGSGGAHARH